MSTMTSPPPATRAPARPVMRVQRDAQDHTLLQRWAQGDKRAGDRLICRYFVDVRAYFIRRVPREHEDLVQETFMALQTAAPRFRGEASVRVFIYCIARNLLRQHISRRRQWTSFDPSVHSIALVSERRLSSLLAEKQHLHTLLDSLEELSVDQQDLLELYYWQGLTGSELKALLEVSEASVRGKIRRALEKLRKIYERKLALPPPLAVVDVARLEGMLTELAPLVRARTR